MKFLKLNRPRLDARRVIYQTMLWSKASYLFIAIAAAIASSIRTVLAISENYAASGAPPWAVVLGAVCFTLVAEIAIFILAIAQEDQIIKWRLAHKRRHITTLRTIGYSLAVRVGWKPALSYDQLPENDGGVGILMVLAFSFAIITNLYIGLRPLINQAGTVSVQSFITHLLNADANVQFTFLIDLAAALFPPFVELIAGRLNARYAAQVTASQRASSAKTTVKSERSKVPAATPPKRSEGRSKKSAKDRVIEYLNEHSTEHPSQHEVARQTGVSIGTVNTVFKEQALNGLSERIGSNGNHKEHE